jgi:serine/threonine protein kinase
MSTHRHNRDAKDGPDERPPRRFRDTAIGSGLVTTSQIEALEAELRLLPQSAASEPVAWDKALADLLVVRGQLTPFQAEQMLVGRRKLTLGQYRILDAIGQGGMGRVFKAEHAMMGREVAIKVLPREKSTPETEAAFRREIRMLGRLDHDNLVRALDAGHDGKVYYLVTELISGLDLRKQVHRYGTLDEVTAAAVITQAARGLAYAHEQGLVHRDVKPGNLLVTPEGRVKVLDLGLAGSVMEEESTRLGRIVGTMDYMAPEQIRSPDTVGPTADVYGLGCTLYFAVVGEVPFPGGTRDEKARRQLFEPPPPIRTFAPQVSEAFCRVIESMMQKDPAERIATATEVIDRLRRWTPEAPLSMPRTPRKSARSRQPPRQPTILAGGPLTGDTERPPPIAMPPMPPVPPRGPAPSGSPGSSSGFGSELPLAASPPSELQESTPGPWSASEETSGATTGAASERGPNAGRDDAAAEGGLGALVAGLRRAARAVASLLAGGEQ